jgi:hypothetical protein
MGEVVNFDREPPTDLGADVRGLPPARAALARFVAWRRREADALAQLEAGRGKLAAQVERAEESKRREEAAVDAEASSIVSQIKQGLTWSLAAIRKRTVEAGPDVEIGKRALGQLNAELEAKRLEVESIGERLAAAADAALREEAGSIAASYETHLSAARAEATKLAALEMVLYPERDQRRIVIEAPGFSVAGDEIGSRAISGALSEVVKAADVWRTLKQTWTENPRADPAKVLRFNKHDPAALSNLPYHELSDVERHVVDAKFANIRRGKPCTRYPTDFTPSAMRRPSAARSPPRWRRPTSSRFGICSQKPISILNWFSSATAAQSASPNSMRDLPSCTWARSTASRSSGPWSGSDCWSDDELAAVFWVHRAAARAAGRSRKTPRKSWTGTSFLGHDRTPPLSNRPYSGNGHSAGAARRSREDERTRA